MWFYWLVVVIDLIGHFDAMWNVYLLPAWKLLKAYLIYSVLY